MVGNYFGIIYKVTNKANNKVYIGQTTQSLKQRRIRHEQRGYYLYSAIRKYGKDAFDWEILKYCKSKEELDTEEKEFIEIYNSFKHGYNLTSGGEGTPGYVPDETVRNKISNSLKGRYCGKDNPYYGKKHSKEVRLKISKSIKGKMSGKNNPFHGKKHSKKSRIKMSESHMGENNNNYGKRFSDEHRRKISKSNKGRVMSTESRKKISDSKKGKNLGSDNVNSRKYIITTPTGEEFIVHGLKNFCEEYNKCKLDHRNLHKCAKGERNHHHGYKCRYCVENDLID